MILIRIALRNLLSHWVKTLIVGGLLVFGSSLLLVGMALLGTIDKSMTKSVVGSVSGNFQVYSKNANDELTLFAGMTDGNDIGIIDNFPKIRQTLEALPQVKAVVPMGSDVAMVYGGNVLDVKLEKLRDLEKTKDAAQSKVVRAHVRRIVGLLAKDFDRISELRSEDKMSDETKQAIADVKKAGSDAFWNDFDKDPLGALEFLDNKVAPLALNADMLWFRYLGTDIDRFAENFELFEIVDGQRIPKGQRGFLFNKLTYEEQVKHRTARRFDKMKDRLAEGFTLKGDDDLQQWRKLNIDQIREITYQLDDVTAEKVRTYLQAHLASKEASLDKLLAEFLNVTDENFAKRFAAFYEGIAPHLMLYTIKVGDIMTIKGFTSAGYPTSVNVKVYGTFRFRSLDKSMMAGGMNLIDMVTFRDLYGYLTADRKEELAKLQAQSGVKPPSHDKAESELFADAGEEVEELPAAHTPAQLPAAPTAVAVAANTSPTAAESGFDEFAKVDMKNSSKKYGDDLFDRTYGQTEIDGGIVRNAAILLKPGANERQAQVAIQQAIDANNLGLKLIDWRTASGMVGKFLGVIYMVLAISLLIIFIVAMVIINNSTVLATMERVREIGSMRAIGAQRAFVLRMFLVEALVSAAVFGLVGCAVGGAIVSLLHAKGIPAFNDVFVFLFAGPRLFPEMGAHHAVIAVIVVTIITVFSTLYPAFLATRITPLQAMQDAE